MFAVDAGSTRSYPGSGTTGTDLISSESITLNNGVGFSTDKGGTWTFDGSDDYIQTSFGQNIVSTGFSVNFFRSVFEHVLKTKNVVAIDIVELNPVYDIDSITAKLAAEIIALVIAFSLSPINYPL